MKIPLLNRRIPLGRFVQPLAAVVPKRAVVPILQGPARGIRWRVGSGMTNFWLGTYEREKYERFACELRPGLVFYDMGANVGIYTVLACRSVGPEGRVFAFEPATMNLFYLHENVRANRFRNCEIVPKAVSDSDGTVGFEFTGESCLGKISDDGLIRVPSVSLDSFCADHPMPSLMKIDVEGAEYEVLIGAREALLRARPIIFLATHGEEVHQRCCRFLESLGYTLEFLGPDEILAKPAVPPKPTT